MTAPMLPAMYRRSKNRPRGLLAGFSDLNASPTRTRETQEHAPPPPPSPKCWWDSNISEARLHTPCGARTRRSRHAISIKHPSILYWSYTKNLTKTHIMHHLPKTSLCNTCGKNATIALRHRQRAKTLHVRARYGTDARYGDGAEEETADPGPATARRVYKTIRLKALRGWSLKAIHWGIARKLCFRVGLRVGLAAFEAW